VARLRRSSLVVLAALAALLAAAVLTACGSASDGSPAQALERTFTGTQSLKSGKLDLGVTITDKRGKDVQAEISGPFQSGGPGAVPSFDLAVSFAVAGQALSAGLTSTGDALYVRFQDTAYQVPAKQFAEFADAYRQAQRENAQGAAGQGKDVLGALGIHPLTWLEHPRIAGTEDVGGDETTHIVTGVNVPALLKDVGTIAQRASSATGGAAAKALSPAEIARVGKVLTNVTVDVFAGKDDHRLRRIVLAGALHAKASAATGLQPTGARISLALSEQNQPQTIARPAHVEPFSRLQAQLQGLFGGAGAPSGSSPVPGGAAAQRYLACVRKGGGDVARVRRCASLIGG